MSSAWKAKAAEKRRLQAESIPPQWRVKQIPEDVRSANEFIQKCDILTAEELNLTEITDGRVLQTMLAHGSVTSEAVITAFSKRAAIAQQLTGCCTEMFFGAALARAKELDAYFQTTGKTVGPLHGIPVSFKDSFDVEGVDTTIGWVGKIGYPAKRNSMGVNLIVSLGAIIYVKTNVPQSLMMSDSYNHVFLQSVNSLNSKLISGGSSGGEGAVVGARGSLIGIGTDIGGSIRIPAALQGLYGLSPSLQRVPNDPSGRSQKYVVPPVAGPIASSLSSIELYMEALLESEPWNIDPQLVPVPWRKELAAPRQQPLKIAFIYDDGIVRPQPPIERTTREMAARLTRAGHEVIDWNVNAPDGTSHIKGYALWLKAVLADGGNECRDLCLLANEPLIEGMLVGAPSDELSVSERKEVSEFSLYTPNSSFTDRSKLEEEKTQYSRAYLRKWAKSGIDALIMPVLPWVGFTPKTWVKSKQIVSYTSQWNLLNYAALTIPASTADRTLDQPDASWTDYVPRNESDDFNHRQYDIELVKDMPVGLQVVGGRFGDEKAVAVAKMIQELEAAVQV